MVAIQRDENAKVALFGVSSTDGETPVEVKVDPTTQGLLVHSVADQVKGGTVSTNNSSTATLAGDAVFTGTGDDVSRFASVSILYKSDVAAAAS